MARNKLISMSLNAKSIDNVINKLKSYKSELLNVKTALFVERLAEEGIQVAKKVFNSDGEGDSDRNADVRFLFTSKSGETVEGRLVASGTDVLFWEFGAGIYYNSGKVHPKAAENGMGVGTYPGQTHAIEPGYWWYKGDDDRLHFSVGTEATMPMYKAWLEMQSSIRKVAKEVFG